MKLHLEYEKEKGVVRVFGGGYGVIYFIVKECIRFEDAVPYESTSDGKCIGFEVENRIDLKIFHKRIRQFAEDYGIEIIV
ncbi:MAG TPA: hypothetical protein EYP78_02150 [Candidatus Omnitrophica bacterium]|nr:hypothetical protein [Candidatus Omnitrophota bacterium]